MHLSRNHEKNGIEISFDLKPDPSITEGLKQRGYRWSNYNKVWYKKYTDEEWEAINKFASSLPATTQIPEKEINEKLMDNLKKDILFLVGLQKNRRDKIRDGWNMSLFKSSFLNKIKNASPERATAALTFLIETEKEIGVKPIFTSKHQIWKHFRPDKQVKKPEERPSAWITTHTTRHEINKKLIEKHGNNVTQESLNKQFDLGILIEQEHTDNASNGLEELRTSYDHLWEDPEYYTKAKPANWAEKELEKEGKANKAAQTLLEGYRPDFMKKDILFGREIQISMPNGEKRNGQFAIVELDNIIASHNEENFHSEPEYPKNASGNNINDRNYKDDIAAQKAVMDYAKDLEPERLITTSRTPSGTPIVTKDGFVVSGNNRTMSLKLAAKQYPDNYKEYVKYLAEEIESFGFKSYVRTSLLMNDSIPMEGSSYNEPKSVRFTNPVLVRIDYEFPEYTTQELAKYNKDTKKAERPVDKAIKLSNILRENSRCSDIIAEITGNYDTFSEFYSNIVAQKKLAKTLIECNLLTQQEMPAYFNDTYFTETGKEFIENLLAALILDREALMAAEQPGTKILRERLITSMPVLMKNAGLPEGSLKKHINDAIIFQQLMKTSGSEFVDFIRQQNLFGTKYDKKTVYLNRLMNQGKFIFKNAIEKYNDAVIQNQGASLFGEKPSIDEIFDRFIISNVNNTEQRLIENSDVVKKEQTVRSVIKENTPIDQAKAASENLDEIRKEFVRFTDEEDPAKRLKIYLIDGNKVRKDHIEFTMGGHGYVYDYVPIDEIWIDENLKSKPDDMEATIKHEVFEVRKMRDEGLDYEAAHELANKIEESERNNIPMEIPKKYAMLNIDYMGAAKGSIGEVVKQPNMFVSDVYFGKNLSGQPLQKRIDNTYLKFIKEPVLKIIDGDSEKFVLAESPSDNKLNPYIAIFNSKQYELYAESLYAAKKKAIEYFKPAKSKEHLVFVKLAEKTETNKTSDDEVLTTGNAYADYVIGELEKKFKERYPDQEYSKSWFIKNWIKIKDEKSESRANMQIEELFTQYLPLSQWPQSRQILKEGFEATQIKEPQKESRQEFLENLHELDMWRYFPEPDGKGREYRKFILNPENAREVTDLGIKESLKDTTRGGKLYEEAIISVRMGDEATKQAIEEAYRENTGIKTVIDDIEDVSQQNKPASLPIIEYGINNTKYFVDFKLQEIRSVDTAQSIKFADIPEEDLKARIRAIRAEFGPNVNMPGLDDKPIEEKSPEKISLTAADYPNEFELNKAIEKLLDEQWDTPAEKWTADQLQFISGYTGYGGLDKFGDISVKSLFEFFTPDKVIEKMWGLAYKYGYKDGPVLEPSTGIGAFFDRRFVSNTVPKSGYEINKYSAKICKLLYPEANINDGEEVKYFEQLFISKNYTVRNKVTPRYKLVIGNPPYGKVGGIYMGMGEKAYTHASNYIEYFILRGLDLLEKDGLLIYIIGAETAAGGVPFLDQGMNKIKEMIMERGKLIDAYRLPSGIFSRTEVTSDIVVFRKK